MKGQFFIFPHKDPANPGVTNLRTGVVKGTVGTEHWLVEFDGRGHKFSNVMNAEQLGAFVFFNTQAEQKAFLDEMLKESQSNTPPPPADVPLGDAAPG